MGVECPKCHFDNPDDTVYCGKCATPLPSSKEIPVTETLETPKEELTTGSTFAGRYQIIEVLGKGGMGKVYRALDKKLNEEVALKLIKPEIASDKKTLERFNNELKFARKISHKNVGRMYELMEEKGTHFITMEYVPGQDLRGLIRQSGQLAVGTAVSIAKQMCEGLTAAHRLGVIHRDLKPQNIMIDKEGNARIMDFGIARSVSGKGITGAGVMVGTPEYMSPEQVESKETDQRSDIYSLGVILYEMVTGRVPFEGDTPLSVAVKHKTEDPLDPKQVNTQIPEDLSHLILRCMEKDKEKRYQSAGEVRSELENIEKGIPTTEKVILKRKPITSREITVQFNLKKIFIPALVILVLIATALVFLWKKGLKLESNRVVVTAFLNQTGDPNLDFLGRRTADMVSQGLKAIGAVEVAPIASFDLGQERKVEEKHYRRIAKNTKAAIVIAGEYYQQGENLAFHSNIYNAKEQKLSPSPEPISGQRVDPSQALERLRNNLMSVVLSLHNPQMETWLTISTYIPKYEALVEFIKGMEFFMRRKYEASIECCDRAIEIDPNYTLSHIVAAVAHNNLRRYSTTAQYLEKVKQIPNLSQGERNLRDWLDAHLKGDNESKFRITQRQEKLAPGTSHSYQLGLDAIRTNRPHIAIEALTRLDPEGVHMKDWISYWGVLRSAYHMI
ncbi:protein kinase, partial [bacterium]|nr:protein kinase [bacterium]